MLLLLSWLNSGSSCAYRNGSACGILCSHGRGQGIGLFAELQKSGPGSAIGQLLSRVFLVTAPVGNILPDLALGIRIDKGAGRRI